MASNEGIEFAQVQAKGNNIVQATLKIVRNGSYSLNMDGGTSLKVTVSVTPCPNCAEKTMTPHKILRHLSLNEDLMHTATSSTKPATTLPTKEHGATNRPFIVHDHDLSSQTPIEEDESPLVGRSLEESEEADPEKSRLVCSDNHKEKTHKLSKKKKK